LIVPLVLAFTGATGAIEITGSPFETFADAEGACNAILRELKRV